MNSELQQRIIKKKNGPFALTLKLNLISSQRYLLNDLYFNLINKFIEIMVLTLNLCTEFYFKYYRPSKG